MQDLQNRPDNRSLMHNIRERSSPRNLFSQFLIQATERISRNNERLFELRPRQMASVVVQAVEDVLDHVELARAVAVVRRSPLLTLVIVDPLGTRTVLGVLKPSRLQHALILALPLDYLVKGLRHPSFSL